MDAVFAIVVAIVALIGLDIAANFSGSDSRPGMIDDHQR
jgi:hypothetical protein